MPGFFRTKDREDPGTRGRQPSRHTVGPRRLLMVADSLGGGLGAAVAEGADWFARRDWDVTVAAPEDDPRALGVEFVPLDIPSTVRALRSDIEAARQLRELASRRHPDVVHCHGLRSFVITRLGARLRAFVTLHGTGQPAGDPRGYGVLRGLGVRAARRLAVGAFSAEPGIAGWRFLPHASPLLRTLEVIPEAPVDGPPEFLWLGRLDTRQKRPDLFVEALAAANERVAVRGLVAGTGPDEEAVRRTAEALGAPVEFLGHRPDVSALLARARAVVLLSRFEAVPFALQEAMWSGRPVVASRLPGADWLVGDGGELVGTVDETAEALVKLASPEVASAGGAAAARRIRTLLTPDDPWPQVEAAYVRATTGAGRPRVP